MSGWVTLPGTFARPFPLTIYAPSNITTEENTMQTIEITTRLRVPDDLTAEQLAAVNIVAAQAVTESAREYLEARVECVVPLQDVIVYGGLVS